MGFINGYATEDDIKIELFLFEPEQISDLVLVPLSYKVSRYLAGLTYTNSDVYAYSTYPYWRNYPFAYNVTNTGRIQPNPIQPLLFQRFNPYNKPFAEQYSTKLFNFLFQFSNDYVNSRSPYARRINHNYETNTIPDEYTLLDLKDREFIEKNINTPNNNLVVEYSYYYPELTDVEQVLYASWRFHNYSNISNECIKNQESKRWLLLFDSKFCNGESFNLRDDLLNCSLVINFIDRPDLELFWTDEDKQFILNQIPDYYLYDNLDNFFDELTNDLLNQDTTLLNDLEFIHTIDYYIEHGWFASLVERRTKEVYQQINLDLKPRILRYANNNNWNNTYAWINENSSFISDNIHLMYLKQSNSYYYIVDENDNIQTITRPYITFRPFTNTSDNSSRNPPRINIINGENIYVDYDTEKRNYYNNYSFLRPLGGSAQIIFLKEVLNMPFVTKARYTLTNFAFPDKNAITSERYGYDFNLSFRNYTFNNTLYTNITTGNEISSSLINNENESYDNFLDLTTNNFTKTYVYNTELQFLPTEEYITNINTLIIQAQENCYMANCDLEDIKKEVKEIHAALDAGKFAYLDGSTENQRVSNLGYYVERIARVLGISVNSDGSIRSIRQSKIIDKGNTIPPGWNIAQWGRNNGANEVGQEGGLDTEEKDGIAWEIKSNKFVRDEFTGEPTAIAQGGYALVENIPQLLHLIFEDLDRAFGLQDAGANVVPSPDGKHIVSYQGINTMLLDVLYMLSQMSRNTSGAHISSLKNQAMLQEIFAALGQPTTINELSVKVSNEENLLIPIPATLKDNPTLMDMLMLVLVNLSLVVGSKIQLKPEE